MTLPMAPDMEIAAAKAVTSVARSMQMSPDKIDEVRMAVVEACINAMEYSGALDRVVHLRVAVLGGTAPEKLQVTVRDTGRGFDPDQVPEPSMEVKLRAEDKRGWGLKIIRGLMDDVMIDSGGGGTTVIMSKLR